MKLRSPKPAAVAHIEAPPLGPDLLLDRGILAAWFVHFRLEQEIERACRYDRPLAVLRARLRSLDGEPPDARALAVAAEALRTASRTTDLVGWDGPDAILIVMPETIQETARVAASRLRSDVWMCTRALGGQRWDIELLDWHSLAA